MFQDRFQELIAFGQGLLGPLALGDVRDQGVEAFDVAGRREMRHI